MPRLQGFIGGRTAKTQFISITSRRQGQRSEAAPPWAQRQYEVVDLRFQGRGSFWCMFTAQPILSLSRGGSERERSRCRPAGAVECLIGSQQSTTNQGCRGNANSLSLTSAGWTQTQTADGLWRQRCCLVSQHENALAMQQSNILVTRLVLQSLTLSETSSLTRYHRMITPALFRLDLNRSLARCWPVLTPVSRSTQPTGPSDPVTAVSRNKKHQSCVTLMTGELHISFYHWLHQTDLITHNSLQYGSDIKELITNE